MGARRRRCAGSGQAWRREAAGVREDAKWEMGVGVWGGGCVRCRDDGGGEGAEAAESRATSLLKTVALP